MKIYAILLTAVLPIAAFAQDAAPKVDPKSDPPKTVDVFSAHPLDEAPAIRALSLQQIDYLTIQIVQTKAQAALDLAAKVAPLESQLDMQRKQAPLVAHYAAQEAALQAWIAAAKKANGWGDDVTYDRQNRKFVRTSAPVKK